ncbi:MAG: hypothetical protein WBE80_02230 [Methylocella sp.]
MPVQTDPDGHFGRNYNRRHFLFRHGLKDRPLFELSDLIALARHLFHHEAYWPNGKVNANDPWGTAGTPGCRSSIRSVCGARGLAAYPINRWQSPLSAAAKP